MAAHNPMHGGDVELKDLNAIELKDINNVNSDFTDGSESQIPREDSITFRAEEGTVDWGQMMWTKEYIGLYSHYAALGFLGGLGGLFLNMCVYYFDGPDSMCPNAYSIATIPWNFKIFFAVGTDTYRPFGLRRKPYMIAGWIGVLFITFILAVSSHSITAEAWVILSFVMNIFLMVADVPADGYSVELGQLESKESRGQILATGQRIRFSANIIAAVFQSLLVNGPSTNPDGCPISVLQCWKWGLTVGQFYGLVFVVCFILFLPILYLKEPDAKNIPVRTLHEHKEEIWDTMKNLTTLYILMFTIGTNAFSSIANMATVNLQYYVIELTNLQSGVDAITTSLAVVVAVWVFQTYLINVNWRTTQYLSFTFTAVLGLQWLLPIYNVGGLRSGWFTIFIDSNQTFAQGITQVLSSMAVIELAKPGQEATTYEMIVSVGNAALTINTIIATQLLGAVNARTCSDDSNTEGCVVTSPPSAFEDTNGPQRYATYTFMILAIQLVSTFLITPFLPKQKDECKEWQEKGETSGNPTTIGYWSLVLSVVPITYGCICALLLISPSTSCLAFVGGDGC